jgi:hypothetical protein
MTLARVRFNTCTMMIGIAALTILGFVAVRFAHAGLLFGLCLLQEREELGWMEEARAKTKAESPPFDEYQRRLAEYYARSAAYHAERKWLYLRAMFAFWAKIPNTDPSPPGLVHPEIPYVPPPRPWVPAAIKPES